MKKLYLLTAVLVFTGLVNAAFISFDTGNTFRAGDENASSNGLSLSKVLEKGNLASRNINMDLHALKGVGNINPLGTGLRIGGPVDFVGNELFSSKGPLKVDDDVLVQGDLEVRGQLEGVNISSNSTVSVDNSTFSTDNVSQETSPSREFYAGNVSVDVNGTYVSLPDRMVNSSYTVSPTPLYSLETVGVFEKNGTGFVLKAENSTRVEYLVVEKN